MLRRLTVTLIALVALAMLVVPGSARADILAGQFQPGDIVVNEVMPNPSKVFDSNGEWFEVYNAANDNVNLNGLELVDDDFDTHIITQDVIIAPGEFASSPATPTREATGGCPPWRTSTRATSSATAATRSSSSTAPSR